MIKKGAFMHQAELSALLAALQYAVSAKSTISRCEQYTFGSFAMSNIITFISRAELGHTNSFSHVNRV
jgi:hypothetical protein